MSLLFWMNRKDVTSVYLCSHNSAGAIFMPFYRRVTMEVIQIQQVKYYIGARKLLDLKHLQVQAGQRIGIIGKNGSGKSTLFSLIEQQNKPDSGSIQTTGRIELLPQLKEKIGHKSGGEVATEYFVRTLAKSPSILLADEPTTNLDTKNIEWVKDQLQRFKGTLLLVSHDRSLLDDLCDTIWGLDEGKITVYTGNYSQYKEQKEIEQREHETEYKKFKQKERQLTEAIRLKEHNAQKLTQLPTKGIPSSEAKLYKMEYTSKQKKMHQNTKALETRLDRLEKVEKPQEEQPIKMDLPHERAFKNKTIIRAEDLEGNIGGKRLWQPTTFFINGGDKVGIIGPNGSGKTTFLKMLLANKNDHLYCSPSMKIGYFDQNINILNEKQTILENVQKDSKQEETLIRTVLARLGFYKADVHKKISVLSGGERVKVSLAKIFVSDCNTLILDEPTNYLDLQALEALEELLVDYEGTILFVTHDRYFVEKIATKILAIENKNLNMFEDNYEQYQKRNTEQSRNILEEERAVLELEIVAVLGELSDPMLDEERKSALDARFEALVAKKNRL